MDPLTTEPADVTIATIVDELARDFISLADALMTESRFATQVPSTAVYDEFSRFKLWAGNIAAHRKGRRSLEYRLRDAAHLKSETHSLLDALSTALRNALSIASGERVPWDELSNSDTDSDSGMSEDGNSNAHLQGSTELSQLLASVKILITSLFRLSMAIRNPAPNSQSTSTISIDKSFFEPHDIQHVMEKFPNAPRYLAERMGRALSARRQYLSYREEHHSKLTKNIEKIGFEKATTEFTTNSTEATPIPRIQRSMSLNVLDEGDDTASQTSYATSVNATIRVPSLPREASNKGFFECPLCFLLVSIHTSVGWKQHVFRDLHPFCCTYEHCTIADRLYDSRKAWFAHELEAHRSAWQCVEGCGKTFGEASDFETHVQMCHPDLASASMLSVLKRTSAKSADLGGQTQCALCGKSMALRSLQRHLGSHQQQLALFALPPNLDNTEDDPNDDERESMIVGEHDDEELSDPSDTSDTEEADDVAEPEIGDIDNDDLMYTVQLLQEESQNNEGIKSALHELQIVRGPPGTGKAAILADMEHPAPFDYLSSQNQQILNFSTIESTEPVVVAAKTNKELDDYLADLVSPPSTVLQDTTSPREEGSTPSVWPGVQQEQAALAAAEAFSQRQRQVKDLHNQIAELNQVNSQLRTKVSDKDPVEVERMDMERRLTTADYGRSQRSGRERKAFTEEIASAVDLNPGDLYEPVHNNGDVDIKVGIGDLDIPDVRSSSSRTTLAPVPGIEVTQGSPRDEEDYYYERRVKEVDLTDLESNLEKMERAAASAATNNEELGDQLEAHRRYLEDMREADTQESERLKDIDVYAAIAKEHREATRLSKQPEGDHGHGHNHGGLPHRDRDQPPIRSAAVAMAIPIADGDVPPPLPSPRHIEESRSGPEPGSQSDRPKFIPEQQISDTATTAKRKKNKLQVASSRKNSETMKIEYQLTETEGDPATLYMDGKWFPEEDVHPQNTSVHEQEEKQEEEQEDREETGQEGELDMTMRNRLAKFGFEDNEVEVLFTRYKGKQKEQQTETAALPTAPQPTYAKIHRTHLDIETLHYYDISYEYDVDPNYIIVLREMTQRETEVLFEHTRRLRDRSGHRLFIEAARKDQSPPNVIGAVKTQKDLERATDPKL